MATRRADNAPHSVQTTPSVVIYGLDAILGDELKFALQALSRSVIAEHCHDLAQCLAHLRQDNAVLVFCSFENGLQALLRAVSAEHTPVPIVAVSRHPEVHQWLDAIEAGAADYCAAPFEAPHLEWILQSNIRVPFKSAE